MEKLKISLKAARVNKGLSQKEAAEAIHVDRGTIIRWENGKSYPDGLKLIELCRLYEIPLDNIFLKQQST